MSPSSPPAPRGGAVIDSTAIRKSMISSNSRRRLRKSAGLAVWVDDDHAGRASPDLDQPLALQHAHGLAYSGARDTGGFASSRSGGSLSPWPKCPRWIDLRAPRTSAYAGTAETEPTSRRQVYS